MRPRTLLWRTVLLLALLLIGVQIAAFQLFRITEREPRARQIAQQLVSVVHLTRAALITADPTKRRALLAELSEREGIRIYPANEHQPSEARIERPGMLIIETRCNACSGRTRAQCSYRATAGRCGRASISMQTATGL